MNKATKKIPQVYNFGVDVQDEGATNQTMNSNNHYGNHIFVHPNLRRGNSDRHMTVPKSVDVSTSARISKLRTRSLSKVDRETLPTPMHSDLGAMGTEKDCLDITFDAIESYTCKQTSGDILYPNSINSPTLPSETYTSRYPTYLHGNIEGFEIEIANSQGKSQVEGDGPNQTCEEKTNDTPNANVCETITERKRPKRRSVGGMVFFTGKIMGTILNRKNRSLPESTERSESDQQLKLRPDSSTEKPLPTSLHGFGPDLSMTGSMSDDVPSPDSNKSLHSQHHQKPHDGLNRSINRENSLLDIESGDDAIHLVSTASLEENSKQGRLEQLRQQKRQIEKRVHLSHKPYGKDVLHDCQIQEVEDIDSKYSEDSLPFEKLQVGSYVSERQERRFFLCQKISFIGTIFLIVMAMIVMIMALCWPGKPL